LGHTDRDSEYLVKLATVKEYQHVIRLKRAYQELAEEFAGLIQEALLFCERNEIPLSRQEKLHRMLEKAQGLVEYRMSLAQSSPEMIQGEESPEDDTAPSRRLETLFVRIVGMSS